MHNRKKTMTDSLNRRVEDERTVLIAPIYSMMAAIGPGGDARRTLTHRVTSNCVLIRRLSQHQRDIYDKRTDYEVVSINTKQKQRRRNNNNNKGAWLTGMKNACVFPCESWWVAPAVNQSVRGRHPFSSFLFFLSSLDSTLYIPPYY